MGRKNKNRENSQQYEDFIPYSKSSKKEKRHRDREKRGTWEIPPATKVVPDKRKKKKGKYRRDDYYECDDWDY